MRGALRGRDPGANGGALLGRVERICDGGEGPACLDQVARTRLEVWTNQRAEQLTLALGEDLPCLMTHSHLLYHYVCVYRS